MKKFAVYSILILSLVGCDLEIVNNTPKNFVGLREEFNTQIIPNSFRPTGTADWPPESDFEITYYEAENGRNLAYLSPDPGDGGKHPAVIWAKGGFSGIGSFLWEEAPADNDQSVRAFLDAGIVTMCPSWRGENTNLGKFELFYGELDDLLDALAYLKKIPYVDPNRIYLVGHSTGGTLALLAAVATDEFRAIFSIGGAPDIARVVEDGVGYGNTPFDIKIAEESMLRSAVEFIQEIRTPTFYFDGRISSYMPDSNKMSDYNYDAQKMSDHALVAGVPLEVHLIKNGNHYNILQMLTPRIARKIDEDNGDTCNIKITQYDVRMPVPRDPRRLPKNIRDLRR